MIGDRGLRAVAALFGPVLLAVCAAPATTEVRWVKTGADDETISRKFLITIGLVRGMQSMLTDTTRPKTFSCRPK